MFERILGTYPLGGIVYKYLLQKIEEERQELVGLSRYYLLLGVSNIPLFAPQLKLTSSLFIALTNLLDARVVSVPG